MTSEEYDKHLQTVIDKLDPAQEAIDAMLEFCCYGEPEFHGSKAMRFFFENLSDLIQNGRSFLYEIQADIEFHGERKEREMKNDKPDS